MTHLISMLSGIFSQFWFVWKDWRKRDVVSVCVVTQHQYQSWDTCAEVCSHTHTHTHTHIWDQIGSLMGVYSEPEGENKCDCHRVFSSCTIIPASRQIIDGLEPGKGGKDCNFQFYSICSVFLSLCSVFQPPSSCGGHVWAGWCTPWPTVC